jgi:adenylate kinase
MIYMFCGAPTAGKTTQGTKLAEVLNLPLISLGAEMRRKAASDPAIAQIMAQGELVPSHCIERVLADVRTRLDGDFVIDGIRLPAEVGYVRKFWPDQAVIAIELKVSADVIRARAAERRASSPTPRADDDPESVERRIAVFEAALPTLLDAFAAHDVPVIEINGDNDRETVHTEIMEALAHASQN